MNTRTRVSILIFAAACLLLSTIGSCRKAEQHEEVQPAPKSHQHAASGPHRVCELCHAKQDEGHKASAGVKLIKELPQLCFGCHPHADYSHSTEVVHGPLAVAECLFCHDPHHSKNEHLLKKPAPELCYGCHKKAAVEAIAGHSAAPACLSCHRGHSSPNKALLKKVH